MKFYDQTEFTDKENNKHGNCLSACLASLLNIELELVPNFCYYETNEWHKKFVEFIFNNKYSFEGTFNFTLWHKWKELLEFSNGIDGVFIGVGISPRFKDIYHAVLYKDNELLYDPHPSRSGIEELKYVYIIEKLNE